MPTSPPSDLECATTYDSLSLTWGNPTIGMVDNTSYQFSYTLVDSMYKSQNLKSGFFLVFGFFEIKFFRYFFSLQILGGQISFFINRTKINILGETGETMSEEFTQAEDYSGEIGDHSLDFSQHIYPATTYEFTVKLVAPDLGAYASEEMESNDNSITCYSNPSKLLGKKRCHCSLL